MRRPYNLPPDWDAWEEVSCVEWNGDHPWVLQIDAGEAFVTCSSCKAEPFESHQDSLDVGPIPVGVRVKSIHYDGPDGTEYDVEFDVWPIGLSR